MSDWKNEIIAEEKISDKVRWVIQKSTSPEGKTLIGLRKFVGSKPTAAGFSLKDVAEIDVLINLLQAAKKSPEDYVIKILELKAYVSGKSKTGIMTTKVRDKARAFQGKAAAQEFRIKHGTSDWLVLKKKV